MKIDNLLIRLSAEQKQLAPLPGEVSPDNAFTFLASTMARFVANNGLSIQNGENGT